jgi:excisionase family DNA binding protein
MQQVKMPILLEVRQVAKTLKRHPRTIYRWLDEGFLHGKKVKKGWLIPYEEIERVLRGSSEDDDP